MRLNQKILEKIPENVPNKKKIKRRSSIMQEKGG